MSGKVNFGLRGGFLDATQVGYFGTGLDAVRGDRANFRLKETYGGATLHIRPSKVTRLEGEVMLEDYKNEEGPGRAPSIETLYNPFSAPGSLPATSP